MPIVVANKEITISGYITFSFLSAVCTVTDLDTVWYTSPPITVRGTLDWLCSTPPYTASCPSLPASTHTPRCTGHGAATVNTLTLLHWYGYIYSALCTILVVHVQCTVAKFRHQSTSNRWWSDAPKVHSILYTEFMGLWTLQSIQWEIVLLNCAHGGLGWP